MTRRVWSVLSVLLLWGAVGCGDDPDTVGAGTDSDGDGYTDFQEQQYGYDIDTDMDGLTDQLDPDDDGDGIPTSVECTTDPARCDTDGDGRGHYPGVRRWFRWLEGRTYRMHVRVLLARYRSYTECPDCHGVHRDQLRTSRGKRK